MNWTGLLVGTWLALLSVSAIKSTLPASWWFQPGSIFVEDAKVGECPIVAFDREISRPFHADWVVTVMRRQASGGFATYRTYFCENDYRPDNELPDAPDLCWWTWMTELPLPQGEYRAHTLWIINPGQNGQREIRRTSNVFAIIS